tara:strand:+ start:558 stop:1046 length:489 start_codon:yes stop_codon:yes gene_type:complete
MSDYKNKYLKYKKKYLNSQKGGSSNSRIEDIRRDDNEKKFSVARIHDPTDLVLEVGQKYVFWGPRNIDGERPYPFFNPINLNYEFEELQYLGQKQVRVIGLLDRTLELTKRRDKVEKILAPEVEGNRVTNLEFQKQHAFRRLNGTGEVLMFLDHQVLDQICF